MMQSSSFKNYADLKQKIRTDNIEAGVSSRDTGGDANELDRFLYDTEAIKDDMRTMQKLQKRLQESNEDGRNVMDAATMKELRAIMESEADHVLILARAIMKRLEGLERSSGKVSGASSSLDRTRISVVAGIGKKVREMMDEFQGLRAKMAANYKEAVEHKYILLTGEMHYIETIENFLSSGEIERLLNGAIQEHGRDRVVNFKQEIQERREGIKYMQRSLIDLHQLFLHMLTVVEAYGQKAANHNDQQKMPHGSSFIRPGAAQLHDSWDHDEKDAKKRATIALILIVVLIVLIIVPIFKSEADLKDNE